LSGGERPPSGPRIGLFGGSFDPIHNGHIRPVQEARRRLGLDRVLYLPTAIPPHKPKRQFAPPHARYTMVELALLSEAGLFASPYELTPERPAFTVETLEHFREVYPAAELVLLLGADSFLDLPTWKRFADLPRLARLAVLARPGWEAAAASPAPPLAELAASGRIDFLAQPPVAVSSTELRALFARGEMPAPGLLPEPVVHYVQKYDLYR
jgi:nicotinate-nucleotide adenylyltransferase